jgi:hypothetical protein
MERERKTARSSERTAHPSPTESTGPLPRPFDLRWIGDANLDLEFNSSDMVQVFVPGKYEKVVLAGWEEGDWNGDRNFDSGDMVSAFVEGGYEKGQRLAAAAPEPTAAFAVLIGCCCLALVQRYDRRRG